ncbi:hypothetical protein CRYUN_Cryun26dG0009200 [Craigia yunnanensis]
MKSSIYCFRSTPHIEDVAAMEQLVDVKSRTPRSPHIKEKCKNLIARIGKGGRKHYNSSYFSYDPMSYALNFEDESSRTDELPIINFMSRLPATPERSSAAKSLEATAVPISIKASLDFLNGQEAAGATEATGSLPPKIFPSLPPMATPQEKPTHTNETWPLRDDDYSQDFEEMISFSGCGCIGRLCWWHRNSNEGHGYLLQAEEIRESWLKNKAKKLKEISEVLAGPRWKNFIRRFSVYGINKKRRSMQFQYDPHSYELNFDEGIQREVDVGFPDFSARFAAPDGIHKG